MESVSIEVGSAQGVCEQGNVVDDQVEIICARNKWQVRRKRKVRGWPVTVTGSGGIVNQRSYAAWRGHMGFPDESPDFSDRDVFDVAFFMIEKQRAKEADEQGNKRRQS